jgi:hypothetical protein
MTELTPDITAVSVRGPGALVREHSAEPLPERPTAHASCRFSLERHSAVPRSRMLIGAFGGALSIGSNLRVTVLDSTGQVVIRPVTGDQIYVKLPFSIGAASLTDEFKALAQAKDLPADVREIPEGSFLGVWCRLLPAARRLRSCSMGRFA